MTCPLPRRRLVPARLMVALALGGLLAAGHARAQFNEADTLRLHAKATATGTYLDGNVRRLLLISKLEVAYAQPAWGFSSRNDYQYGYTGPRKTEDDVLTWNFVYRRPLARAYPYLMFLGESNFRRGLVWRSQPGAGLSYNVLRRPGQLLRLSLTGSYERSAYRGTRFEHRADTTSSVISTWRTTVRVFGRHQLAHNRLRLYYELWDQQALTVRDSYRFFGETTLELPLSKRLSLRGGLRYTYERVELEGNVPYDLFATYGVSFSNF